MPAFLGFQIASDPESQQKRIVSPNGFLPGDEPLIEFMKLMERKNGKMQPNASFPTTPDERRDFLTWIVGSRSPPLPPIARRILCHKRAVVSNSIKSIGDSDSQRTSESGILQEIDAILKQDDVTNPEQLESCIAAPSKFKSAPPLPPQQQQQQQSVSGNKQQQQEQQEPVSGNKQQGCHTSLTCDTSALTALITDIKTTVDKLIGMYDHKETPETMELAAIQSEMMQIRELLAKPTTSANATSVNTTSMNAKTTEPQVDKETVSEMSDIKASLQTILDELRAGGVQTNGIPGRVLASTATMISQLRKQTATLTTRILTNVDEIKRVAENTKLSVNTLHAEIADMRDEMRASMENIKSSITTTPFVTVQALTDAVQQLRELIETTSKSGRNATVDGIQRVINELGTQITALHSENTTGQHTDLIRQHQLMQSQLQSIADHLNTVSQDHTTQITLEELRTELAELRGARSPNGRVSNLSAEQQAKNERIAELETKIIELEATSKINREELQSTINQLNAEKQALDTTIMSLTEKIAEIMAETQRLAASNSQKNTNLQGLQSDLTALTDLKEQLEASLQECTVSKATLEQQQRGLQVNLDSTQSSLSRLQSNLKKAQADVTERNAKYNALKVQHERNIANSIEEAINETRTEYNDEMNVLRTTSAAEINKLRKENTELKEKLIVADPAKLQEKDKQITNLTKRSEDLARRCDTLKESTAELDATKEELARVKSVLASTTAELDALRSTTATAEAEHEKTWSNMATIERNRNTARLELKATGINRDAQKQRADLLQSQLNSERMSVASTPATIVTPKSKSSVKATKADALNAMNYSGTVLQKKYIDSLAGVQHRAAGNTSGVDIVATLYDIYKNPTMYNKDIVKTNLQRLKTFVPHIFTDLAAIDTVIQTNYIAYLSDLFEKLMKYKKPQQMRFGGTRRGQAAEKEKSTANKFGSRTRKARRI